jgi:hypothetical protein
MYKLLVLVVLLFVATPLRAADSTKPIKVFILAGQSNMEGHAKVSLLDYQSRQPETRGLFEHLRKDGKWLERDNVWIKFLDRKGKLTVGYGSPGCIGPELEFGAVVGDRYSEPVLLIKTAWGGRSLYRDFRSPSAGMPPPKVLEKKLVNERKRKPDATLEDVQKPFGASYRAMLEEIHGTLSNLKTLFPEYADQGYEIAGFAWFQGFNDMIDPDATAEYTSNLIHLIHDVRKDLKVERMPIVVGQMGIDGANPSAEIKRFKAAEAAAVEIPEFRGNVALVKTDQYWDSEADAVFKTGWQKHKAEWDKVGSDYPYHYLGSVKTMCRIGRAFGEAMLELRGEKKSGK